MRLSVFSFFRKILQSMRASFSRFVRRQPLTVEKTYDKGSFISHFSDTEIQKLFVNNETEGVLSKDQDQMPHVVLTKFGAVKPGFSKNMAEQNEQDQNHLKAIVKQKGGDGIVYKLANVRDRESHVVRLLEIDDENYLSRMSKVQRLLGKYAVKLYHHRHINFNQSFSTQYYVSEMQFVDHLKNAKEYLLYFTDPGKREVALLDFTKQLLGMLRHFQKVGLRWPDMKPGNFFINTETGKLVVADTKNIYTNSDQNIPLYSFTKDYCKPDIFNSGKRSILSSGRDYKDQVVHSVLASLRELLAMCDANQAASQRVEKYIRMAGQENNLFSTEKHLYSRGEYVLHYFKGRAPRISTKNRLKSHNSNSNIHRQLKPIDAEKLSKELPYTPQPSPRCNRKKVFIKRNKAIKEEQQELLNLSEAPGNVR